MILPEFTYLLYYSYAPVMVGATGGMPILEVLLLCLAPSQPVNGVVAP